MSLLKAMTPAQVPRFCFHPPPYLLVPHEMNKPTLSRLLKLAFAAWLIPNLKHFGFCRGNFGPGLGQTRYRVRAVLRGFDI